MRADPLARELVHNLSARIDYMLSQPVPSGQQLLNSLQQDMYPLGLLFRLSGNASRRAELAERFASPAEQRTERAQPYSVEQINKLCPALHLKRFINAMAGTYHSQVRVGPCRSSSVLVGLSPRPLSSRGTGSVGRGAQGQ